MIIVNDGRSTTRLDGRWHSRVHLLTAGVTMERGERRFLHDGRWLPLRSFAWLVVLFFVTAAAFGLPLQAGVDLLPPERTDLQFGATLIASACALALYALAVRLGEGRHPRELALRPAFKELAVGVALGLLLMVILMAVMALSGLYAITWVGLVPVWGGLTLAVQAAVTEELWMRALLFRLLWRAFGPLPAFALSALVFGALHLANPGATLVAGATVTLAGLMFCALYTLTGRLWVPIGLHLAWNFAQGSLFGAAVSGGQLGSSVAQSTAREATEPWLTGGTFGPEASVLALLLISLVTLGALVLAHLQGRFVVPPGTSHDYPHVVHHLDGRATRPIPSHPAGESPRGVDLGNPSTDVVVIPGWVLKLRRKDELMLAHALVQIASVSAASLIGFAIVFQVALATGAPWGSAAYGGRFVGESGRLPIRYRATSAVAAIALSGVAWLILAAGSAIGGGPLSEGVLTAAMWAAGALFALNTVGNLSGTHWVERFGASGLTALLTVLCLVIVVGR